MLQEDKERFLSKVEKQQNGCWIWIGSYFSGKTRGQFWFLGTNWQAARAAWVLFRGDIPDGKMICHKRECSDERCVNPDHLYPGDQSSNMADRDAVGRTSRWDHRYNFVQTPEVEAKAREMRTAGHSISDICTALDIGRTTYYRMLGRGVINNDVHREAARANYRKAAQAR
jgi:HNH endonuclease/Helix-turn-helix domain of resolvase